MTKHIRIENADTSSYKVLVQVWDKGYPEGAPDVLQQELTLHNPCDLIGANRDLYITSTRYIVVKEA